jgi:hypothetical protein
MEIKKIETRVLLTALLIFVATTATVCGRVGEKICVANVFSGSAQGPSLEWSRTYVWKGNAWANSVVQTIDGGYAMAGWTDSSGGGEVDFLLVKVNAVGNMLWNHTYGGAKDQFAFSLVQASDGGFALAGYTNSFGAGDDDFWLVKTDALGNMEWNQTYGGTANDEAYWVIQTSDGGYALAGYTDSFGNGVHDIYLVKTVGASPTASPSPPPSFALNPLLYIGLAAIIIIIVSIVVIILKKEGRGPKMPALVPDAFQIWRLIIKFCSLTLSSRD